MESTASLAIILLPSGVALLGSALGTAFLRRQAARWMLLDIPNARSSHRSPVPRGGGLGFLFGFAGGLFALFCRGGRIDASVGALLVGVFALGGVGLWDDVRRLPVWTRLVAELIVAAWVVSQVGSFDRMPLPEPARFALGPIAFAASIVWLVGVANFFNFMDGIDGLAGGQAVVACMGVLVAGWSRGGVLIAGLALAALLGFLPYNWWPSKIFLGDVGSLSIGFLLAGLPLLAPLDRRPDAVLAMAIGLALFLLDPIETLVRRWRRGAAIGQSHRGHRYQQLLAPDEPHGRVAAALVVVGLLLSLAGSIAYRHPIWGWPSLALAGAAFLAERHLAETRSTDRAAKG